MTRRSKKPHRSIHALLSRSYRKTVDHQVGFRRAHLPITRRNGLFNSIDTGSSLPHRDCCSTIVLNCVLAFRPFSATGHDVDKPAVEYLNLRRMRSSFVSNRSPSLIMSAWPSRGSRGPAAVVSTYPKCLAGKLFFVIQFTVQ